MNRMHPANKSMGMAIFTILAMTLILSRPALAAQDAWPKRFEDPKGTVVMYQPQLEDYKDDVLTARAAVSVKTKITKTPVFGAVWLSGRVLTDRDTRMSTISEIKVTDAKFPDAKPEQLEKLKDFLNTELDDLDIEISLDRLTAALEVLEKEEAGDKGLKNDPPKIIFVSHPAVLVPLDGDPKLLPVPKSSLMRVANTGFPHALRSRGQDLLPEGGRRLAGRPGPQRSLEGFGTSPGSDKDFGGAGKESPPGQGRPQKSGGQGGQDAGGHRQHRADGAPGHRGGAPVHSD